MAERWEDSERARRDEREFRGYGERDRTERAADEVRSWFGDDDAARRRQMDELRDRGRDDREWGGRAGRATSRAWEHTKEAARDITDRDRDGRRGMAEWNDRDRPWNGPRPYGPNQPDSNIAGYWSGDHDYNRPPNYGTGHGYGPYAGRGPRGYTRGDERIREDVCDRLTDDPRIDASDVDVTVKDGEVTLAGSVRSRDEKRFTEDVVERISGVRDVNNHLKVKAADEVIGTARSGSSVLGLTDAPPPPPSKTK